MKMRDNWKESIALLILGVFFLGYYSYRMFAITPWYDEVYTYINFIDKGFLYSATHWPLPNNHVFFSMLSALFKFCGIYIGLRGVSFLAALGTLVLLYLFLKRSFSITFAFLGTMVYGMLYGVNLLAVQGRGYSLATFFLILSLYCGQVIATGKDKKRYYICFAVSLWLGLYTLMSSVYWVIPVCLCCGIVLLLQKKYRSLIKLIIASVSAAFFTIISYVILWMSIGAQQISNDIMSGYYQAQTGYLAVEFPRTCLLRGLRFMTADQNLQSMDRRIFLQDFRYFARSTVGSLFNRNQDWILYSFYGAVILSGIILLGTLIKKIYKRESMEEMVNFLAALISSVGFLALFLILLIQSVYPFTRVFSFLGIFLVCLFCFLVWQAIQLVKKVSVYEKVRPHAWLFLLGVFCICIYQLTSPTYNREYDLGDYYAQDAIAHVDWSAHETYFASDVFTSQQVQYQYILGKGFLLSEDRENPEIILLRKGENAGTWPDRFETETIEALHAEERTLLYENERYLVYE